MYELKKYLRLKDPHTLKVYGASDVNENIKNSNSFISNHCSKMKIYKVVHFKPFEYTEENMKKFLQVISQGYIKVSNFKNTGTNFSRTEGIISKEASVLLNGIKFELFFSGKETGFVTISSEVSNFEAFIQLSHNKNNFSLLKRIKGELDSMTDWDFIKRKMEEVLLNKFGKKLTVNGYVKAKIDEDEEKGSFKIILHKDLMEKLKLKSISFNLKGKELEMAHTMDNIPTANFNILKDSDYYRDISKQYKILADTVDQIQEEVHWVIFSSRREERLKQLLDNKELIQ